MSGRWMLYCYFIFETSKQGQDVVEDTKLQVFHLFQETQLILKTLLSDHDHTPHPS